MSSGFQTIILSILVLFVVAFCGGCKNDNTEVLNAVGLIVHADSLRSKGELFTDTAKIKHAIDVLEHSFPRKKELLGKAYFLMGRNYDVLHMDTKEVGWFIKCIEERGADVNSKKRSLIHLINICIHQNFYNTAEELNKKELSLLIKNQSPEIDINIAKLSLAKIYIEKKEFEDAKKIIYEISNFLPDSILSSYYYNIMFHIHKETQNSDSAEYYAKKCIYAYNINLNKSNAPYFLQIAEIKEQQHLLDSTIFYIKRAITEPLTYNDSLVIKNLAYQVYRTSKDDFSADLFKKFYQNHTITHKPSTEEAQAAILIDDFYNKTLPLNKKNKHRYYALIIFFTTIIVYIITLLLKNKHKLRQIEIKYIRTRNKLDNSIDKLNTLKYANRITEEEIEKLIQKTISMYQSLPIWETDTWKDEQLLEKELNTHLNNLGYKLKKKSVSFTELRICVLMLCGCERAEISDKAFISINSIENYKSRLALKLETPRRKIREQLIKIIQN